MSITDVPMLKAIREKLKFHTERQRVLAENVANASTPDYVGRDLEAPDFFRVAASAAPAEIRPAVTQPGHLPGRSITAGVYRVVDARSPEVTPDGNAVSLEDQMVKVADNQMDYQVAASLYQRGLALMKIAIGKA